MERKYTEEAERLINAIKALAADPDSLDNFKLYLELHAGPWYDHYITSLDGLISELEQFATPALPF